MHVKVNQRLPGIDCDAIVWQTPVHRFHEPNCLCLVKRDQQEIVNEPEKEAVRAAQEAQLVDLKICVEVIAQERR